jgi:hypothetical protein
MEALLEATTPLTLMIYRTDPARVDTTLSTALIVAILPPGNRGTIILHIRNQRPSLHHTNQYPRLRAPAAAVVLSIEAVFSYRKYPGMVRSVSHRTYPRESPRLILKPLFPLL